jgi:predicted RNase H-like HicB family nuclease
LIDEVANGILGVMKTVRCIYWQDEDMWLGHLEEYPDYITQGESIEELRDNLKDLHEELISGRIRGVRRVAEFRIARSEPI